MGDGAGAGGAWGRPGIWAGVALGAVYLGSAALCCSYAAASQANFVDLHVYRMGATAALHGIDVYQPRYYWLSFTYPPFAALVFVAGTVIPFSLAAAVLAAGSVLALPIILYLALRLPSPTTRLAPRQAIIVGLATAAVAIWLEPVRTALAYGQIDLWIDAAVLFDLRQNESSRWKGAAIGVAAGIKLTPAIFAVYLLVTRRYRAAAAAAAAFAATVLLGFVVLPASSAHYWGGMFLNPNHIGQVQDIENQSLLGAMARTFGTARPGSAWLVMAVLIAVAGLALAASASSRGDEATGFALCAITGLLVSPISWSHHWVLAIPALMLAAVALYRCRDRRPLALTVLGTAAVAGLAAIGWARLARSVPSTGWLHLGTKALVYSEIYVLAGLAVIVVAIGAAAVGPGKSGTALTTRR
ncbi:MAG TPA: glycosyltransferase 87 family protein [Streptosporangiaceae bacterium]